MPAIRWFAAAAVPPLVAVTLLAPASGAHAALEIDAGGSTIASGVSGLLDSRPGLLIVQDVIHPQVGYVTTSFGTTGASSARAASYFPGEGPLAVPGLVCQATPVCGRVPPPDYPLIAEASHPTSPEAKATASGDPQVVGPVTTTPALVTAAASATSAAALVVANGVGLAPITVGAVRTATSQEVKDGQLLLRSEVLLSGVVVAGGLEMDQVRSESVVQVLPDRTSTGKATTTVTGATVGGIPATVSAAGISVNGQGDGGAAGKAAQDALAQLAAAGVQARVLPPAATMAVGKGAASTGGLLVSLERDVEGVPLPVPGVPDPSRTYVGTFNLAAAGVQGFAAPAATFSTPDLPPLLVDPPSTDAGFTVAEAPAPPPADLEPALSVEPGIDAPAPPAAQPLAAPGSELAPAVAAGAVVPNLASLENLALALLLYPLIVLAAALRRGSSRLPGLLRTT